MKINNFKLLAIMMLLITIILMFLPTISNAYTSGVSPEDFMPDTPDSLQVNSDDASIASNGKVITSVVSIVSTIIIIMISTLILL